MQDFQISTIEDIEFDLTDELDIWVPIGKINGRYQYIYTGGGYNTKDLSFADIDSCCHTVELLIDLLKKDAEKFNIPIDGIVISILNPRMVETLGRNNDKNMFQVAYKFSAGEEKTTINDVEFQVGPVYGHITPVAKVSPVVINGNTITSVSLSNKDKFDSLNLHLGDEVIIRYDIIPTLYKDSTCKESDYPLIEFPTNCPTCGAELIEGRCPNSECAAKVIGHIYKFVETLKIPNIGFKTIEDLYIAGILETIGDLYRLYRHKDIICNIPGYGESSTTLILDGISSVRKIPAYRLFGAIGIPNIGVKTMEKVCREINVFEHLDDLESMRSKLIAIDGIGAKKADLIISGIENKIDVIKDICANVDIIEEYEVLVNPTGEVVCFTNVRDSKFEDFLRSKGVDTSDSFTSKVTTLIVPDEPMDKETTKVTKAKDKGIEIITISEAYSRWGYQN
jgi:NAD-dependent DNA ligase